MMFQFEMSATSSSPVVNSAMEDVPSLYSEISLCSYSRTRSSRLQLQQTAKDEYSSLNSKLKQKKARVVSIHRPATGSKGKFLDC